MFCHLLPFLHQLNNVWKAFYPYESIDTSLNYFCSLKHTLSCLFLLMFVMLIEVFHVTSYSEPLPYRRAFPWSQYWHRHTWTNIILNIDSTFGCVNRTDRESHLEHYHLPAVFKNQGNEFENLSSEWHCLWIANINSYFCRK